MCAGLLRPARSGGRRRGTGAAFRRHVGRVRTVGHTGTGDASPTPRPSRRSVTHTGSSANSIGEPVSSVAIPFGSYDRRVLRRLRGAGLRRVYTSDGGRARTTLVAPGPQQPDGRPGRRLDRPGPQRTCRVDQTGSQRRGPRSSSVGVATHGMGEAIVDGQGGELSRRRRDRHVQQRRRARWRTGVVDRPKGVQLDAVVVADNAIGGRVGGGRPSVSRPADAHCPDWDATPGTPPRSTPASPRSTSTLWTPCS